MVRTLGPLVRVIDTRCAASAVKRTDPFYSTPEWRQFQSQIIAERGRVCEDPTCDGRTHKPGMRVFADHLVELQDGGAPFDPRNIMLRCGASHTRKTLAVRGERLSRRF